jgi:hypothetical protein
VRHWMDWSRGLYHVRSAHFARLGPKNFAGHRNNFKPMNWRLPPSGQWSPVIHRKYSELTPLPDAGRTIGWEKDHPKLDAGTQNF